MVFIEGKRWSEILVKELQIMIQTVKVIFYYLGPYPMDGFILAI